MDEVDHKYAILHKMIKCKHINQTKFIGWNFNIKIALAWCGYNCMGGIVFMDNNKDTDMIGHNGWTGMAWMNINNMVKIKNSRMELTKRIELINTFGQWRKLMTQNEPYPHKWI